MVEEGIVEQIRKGLKSLDTEATGRIPRTDLVKVIMGVDPSLGASALLKDMGVPEGDLAYEDFLATLFLDGGSVKSGGGNMDKNVCSDAATVAAELVRLREGLQELRRTKRPVFDGSGSVPMDPSIMHEFRRIIEECQGLQHYSEQGIMRVGQQVEVRGMSGQVTVVTVNPETDSVQELKLKVAERCGIKPFKLKLFPHGSEELQAEAFKKYEAAKSALSEAQEVYDEAAKEWSKVQDMQMLSANMLSTYDLTKGITMVVSDQSIEDEKLRFLFDNPEDLGFESLSGKSGTWLFPEQKHPVDTQGRRGIDFQGYCVLRMPEPIVLGDSWTISLWTLAPIARQNYRNLVDDTGDNQIVMSIVGGRIGDYNLNSWVNYDPGTLPAGWHHIAAVGRGVSVDYYVNGEPVGQHAQCSKGRLSTVGNRGDGQCPEAWGVMSDLRIFAREANADQIRALAQGM